MGALEKLAEQIGLALVEVMAESGYGPLGQLSAARVAERDVEIRFNRFDSPLVAVNQQITAVISKKKSPGLVLIGWSNLFSRSIGEVRSQMDGQANLVDTISDPNLLGVVESQEFGQIVAPERAPLYFSIAAPSDIQREVTSFASVVSGAISGWFDARSTLSELTELARRPLATPWDQDNPGADRLRSVVILQILNGREDDAAILMAWYLNRNSYRNRDSRERAAAFDVALAEIFPTYARARKSIN
ncbi:hypothetical protein AB0H76_31470 [Nocardia sp. NPDC050712]|uniref:hypothetical protein n=1 Tax=Nocardia sp. NPDC050712 TaxID=3155518 RepID=UPI0033C679EB